MMLLFNRIRPAFHRITVVNLILNRVTCASAKHWTIMRSAILLVTLYLVYFATGTFRSKNVKTFQSSSVADRKQENEPFFPDDRTQVTWAHAVNSQKLLTNSLNDSNILMLEADIQLGYLIGTIDLIPIMAHPPIIISDLSFEMFLTQVLEHNSQYPEDRKGIKLDVKKLEAAEPVLKILQQYNASKFDIPVWFNADILVGPINSTGTPVNGVQFLNLTSTYLPEATLSPGWTTRYSESVPQGKYEMENVNEMLTLLQAQHVSSATAITYPVRAGLAAQSIDEMLYLVNSSEKIWPNSSLTLWSSAGDPVDIDALKQLISLVGKHRCFTDLPFVIPE